MPGDGISGGDNGQLEPETAATSFAADYADVTTVGLDQALYGRQSQSDARLRTRSGADEGLEDRLLQARRNTGSGVRHFNAGKAIV